MHAGTGAQNIIPGSVQVDFNFRFSTESTPESLQARVREILDRNALDYAIDWIVGGKPFLTKRGRLVETLTSVVKKVSGVSPEINCTGGTSDGRFIIDICPEVAEFGPVNRSIHKVNEAVAIDEIGPHVFEHDEFRITPFLRAFVLRPSFRNEEPAERSQSRHPSAASDLLPDPRPVTAIPSPPPTIPAV